MEGLKIIAQATFDKHQKFQASEKPLRYSVIEIGAFGSKQPSGSTTTASKRQSTDNVQIPQSGSEAGTQGNGQDDSAAEGDGWKQWV